MAIEEKILGTEKWKDAEKDLKEFEKTMKLIKQYPLETAKPLPLSPPYEPTNSGVVKLTSYNL